MIRATLVSLAFAMAGAAGPCTANDTSAGLDAGGLVFLKSEVIQIESEVLTISPEIVEIDYVFANPSAVDVTTIVAFPLPDLNLADMAHSPSSIPFRGRQNFVGFRTWVDGKEIKLNSEVHAILDDGRDIAKDLQSLGVNIFTEQDAIKPETRSQLLKLGALVDGGYDDIFPVWTAKTSYYWTQTFPAGKDLHIHHRYSAGALERLTRDREEEWCTDDAYKAAFAKLPQEETGYVRGKAVRYVLKTGANWAGPIGDFTLKLDKAAAALVSTCPIPGLTLTRQGNAFVAHAEKFTPKGDLDVLFAFAHR